MSCFLPTLSIRLPSLHLRLRTPILARKLRISAARQKSEPRIFPTQGFDVIDKGRLIEEETIPEYKPEYFYPARIGEVFNDRFQIVSKLGYGSSSTIWLAHDLQSVGLKIQFK